MTFLQAESLGIFERFADYGVLGLVTLGLGVTVWYLLKRQIAVEERLQTKVDDLQDELTTYIREDREKMQQTLDNNTKAINDLREIILSMRKP
jgi:uncharacterized protein HemX